MSGWLALPTEPPTVQYPDCHSEFVLYKSSRILYPDTKHPPQDKTTEDHKARDVRVTPKMPPMRLLLLFPFLLTSSGAAFSNYTRAIWAPASVERGGSPNFALWYWSTYVQ